jgi:hypothetical protein
VAIGQGGKLLPGKLYRLHTYVRAPYNEATVAVLKKLYRARFMGQNVEILRFEYAAPMYSAHGTGQSPFPFHVVLRAKDTSQEVLQAGIDPRGILAVAALVVLAGATFALISSKLEMFVETVGDEVRRTVDNVGDNLNKTVFNPGLLILAFGAFYLYTKGK